MKVNEQLKRWIHLLYGIALAVMIVIAGICLISSCVQIYHLGDSPFTRERIGEALGAIQLPLIACVAGTLIGAVLSLTLPFETKTKGDFDGRIALARLHRRINPVECSFDLRERLKKESEHRVELRVLCALFCAVVSLPALIYLLDFSHYSDDLNGSVISALYLVVPTALICGAALLCEQHFERLSIARETTLVKELIAAGNTSGWGQHGTAIPETESHRVAVWVVRILLIGAAIVMIVNGIGNGGMADVLNKAIKICTECIGLG